jgi:recombination protein RecA
MFPSGSTILDLINGGGWGIGRMANIVGDKSSGKSLLAIEACANFANLYGVESVRYNETEAAFDRVFATSIGMPDGVAFTGDDAADEGARRGSRTVEEFNDDLAAFLADRKGPCLYVLDSADALSDDAEMGRNIGDATYGTGKAKAFSELFRRCIADIERARCSLLIISQIRDKIGVTFGETKTRSGGRALDFYASQVVWLSEIKKEERQVSGVKRVVGVKVLAANKKNKMGLPFRRAEFNILFNYGIDDEMSMIDWLEKNKLGGVRLPRAITSYEKLVEDARAARDRDALHVLASELRVGVRERWNEIEDALRPTLSKYE